jgi:hypothetical protein
MGKLVMNPGVYPDYDDLGARLRGIDKLEVAAVNQWSPEVAIRNSIRISSKWWVGTINGVEEMVVGVAPVQGMDRWGAPWMLSSDKFLHSPSIKERPWHTFRGFRFLEFIRVTPGGHYDLDNLHV